MISIRWYNSFLHFKTFEIQYYGTPLVLCSSLQNTDVNAEYDTFKHRYSFSAENVQMFVYSMFSSQFDVNLAQIPWTNMVEKPFLLLVFYFGEMSQEIVEFPVLYMI